MAEVVGNLSEVPDGDVRAIATYMADVLGAPTPDRKLRGEQVLAQVKTPSMPPAKTDAPGASIQT